MDISIAPLKLQLCTVFQEFLKMEICFQYLATEKVEFVQVSLHVLIHQSLAMTIGCIYYQIWCWQFVQVSSHTHHY